MNVHTTNVRFIDKDPRNQWTNEPKVNKVKVFVTVNAEDGLDFYELPKRDRITAYREAVRQALALIEPEFGDIGNIRWNAKAGCSCYCSPGFVTEAVNNRDIFVTADAWS